MIRIGFSQVDEQTTPVLVIDEQASNDSRVERFRDLLGLDPSTLIYPIRIGNKGQADNRTLNISTRSLMGVMYYLSHAVNVPQDEIIRGIVTETYDAGGYKFNWEDLTEGLFKVESSGQAPEGLAPRTYYRNNWFYIDDRDLNSKSTFFPAISTLFIASWKG